MQRRSKLFAMQGFTLLDLLVVIILLLIVAAVLFPVFARTSDNIPKSSCQSNLKELALAMQMYLNDYDETLPSSALRQKKTPKYWDPLESAQFCAQRGMHSVPPGPLAPEQVHLYQLLWPHMKNKDIIWCPKDRNKTTGYSTRDEETLVSYFYRPALDRAWFGFKCPVDISKPNDNLVMKCFRKAGDFEFAADQILFFERLSWHWGGEEKGWRDGVTLNCAFLDGHVRNVRMLNTVGRDAPDNVGEFSYTISEPGEPMWYNYDKTSNTGKRAVLFDPRRYYDNLP